ncbi:MAG: nicotinate-nucleotide--dimethylbenzimidazole phosphoribosyltransferase [Sterolibacterium sp.]|jgi:nicotinate-nucleotide--dimethylbenzimidazole phosphoribosyltransferase|nr:nicotinate-nucleotide--dimethylbenzimidazole phosphoribosyltransferase [Sterolibacterium sp.]
MKPDWLDTPLHPLDTAMADAARARQNQLTKPPGALGELEEIAIRLAAMQSCVRPRLDAIRIAVFAADHGICAEGISAFPQAVTGEMIKNFARGGAAISVLARQLGALLEVIDLGTATGLRDVPGVLHRPIAAGTANFAHVPAMTAAQCALALDAGRAAIARAVQQGTQLFIGGEMGIGNTTAAAALACALLNEAPERLAGPGTGLDRHGVSHKAHVIGRALELHRAAVQSPFEALRHLGGFEIAALSGAYIAAAQAGLPVLIDGFITTAAALTAERLHPGVSAWFFYGHGSAEPGHAHLLAALNARPLLSLGMRLGEASGAAVAAPLLRLACQLHDGMATFAEAAVSQAPEIHNSSAA